MINELFEKMIYESDDFKKIQKNMDHDVEQLVARLCSTHELSAETVRDEIMAVLYQTEQEMFALGFQCGVRLMHESGISSNDVHNL